ncbi:cytochrome c oxidase assembly protein [Pradoshia sp.]
MHHDGQHSAEWVILPQVLLSIPFVLVLIFYMIAVFKTNQTHRQWPVHRIIFLCAGTVLAILSVAGPLAERSYTDFRAHMAGHLFLGMLAPLLIALAAPMTLMLRTLHTGQARRLTKWLKSPPVGLITNPVTAAFLNIGGLWLLYTTSLYSLMHEIMWLHVLIHAHIFLAGYLFTVSLIYIDPIHHRVSYLNRAIVLVLSLAWHNILAKYLYANPPNGVPMDEAQTGAMLMYYGGDFVDAAIIFILCLHWYRAARPRVAFNG